MSEERKDEILDKEKELDEGEVEAVAGGYHPCVCIYAGDGNGNSKPGFFALDEGKREHL